ncbi:MAG: NRDE family protein [Gammaproteobacteria bacterium]|jgi:uncharacterized protein with NRDE domain
MCLIVLAYRYHTQLPLVIAANRDEFHARPTRQARFWRGEAPQRELLAGQDLTQGGTWLGLSRRGRFAAVTNIRMPGNSTGSRSRGFLTRDFLLGKATPADYLASLLGVLEDYAGFNLLAGDANELCYLNSRRGEVVKLQPGIYGLSNGALDSDWPKVHRSKAALKELLGRESPISTDRLTAIMLDRNRAPDDQLPDTGFPIELERNLSPSFIVNPQRDYGTRCTTAVIINQQGTARFSEQNYAADTCITARRLFHFPLQVSQF